MLTEVEGKAKPMRFSLCSAFQCGHWTRHGNDHHKMKQVSPTALRNDANDRPPARPLLLLRVPLSFTLAALWLVGKAIGAFLVASVVLQWTEGRQRPELVEGGAIGRRRIRNPRCFLRRRILLVYCQYKYRVAAASIARCIIITMMVIGMQRTLNFAADSPKNPRIFGRVRTLDFLSRFPLLLFLPCRFFLSSLVSSRLSAKNDGSALHQTRFSTVLFFFLSIQIKFITLA